MKDDKVDFADFTEWVDEVIRRWPGAYVTGFSTDAVQILVNGWVQAWWFFETDTGWVRDE